MQAKTCHQDVLKLNNRSRGGINFVSYISGRKPSIFQILWLFHDCNHNHGKSSSNPFYTSWEDEEARCNQYNQEAQFHSMYCSSKNMEVFWVLGYLKKIKIAWVAIFLVLVGDDGSVTHHFCNILHCSVYHPCSGQRRTTHERWCLGQPLWFHFNPWLSLLFTPAYLRLLHWPSKFYII